MMTDDHLKSIGNSGAGPSNHTDKLLARAKSKMQDIKLKCVRPTSLVATSSRRIDYSPSKDLQKGSYLCLIVNNSESTINNNIKEADGIKLQTVPATTSQEGTVCGTTVTSPPMLNTYGINTPQLNISSVHELA